MIDMSIYSLAYESTTDISALESYIDDLLYDLHIDSALESVGTNDNITELADKANALKERAKTAKSEAEKKKILDEYRKINDEIGRLQRSEKSTERKRKLLKAAKIVGACVATVGAIFGIYKGGKALSKKFGAKAKLKAESDARIQAINKQIEEDKAAADKYIKELRESTEKAIKIAEQALKDVGELDEMATKYGTDSPEFKAWVDKNIGDLSVI